MHVILVAFGTTAAAATSDGSAVLPTLADGLGDRLSAWSSAFPCFVALLVLALAAYWAYRRG